MTNLNYRSMARTCLAVVIGVAALGVASSGPVASADAASRSTTAASSVHSTFSQPSPLAVKVPVFGMLDRHHAPPSGYSSVIHSYVVDTSWADLEPDPFGPIVHPNAIDSAITYARANNMTLTLRVNAGIDAPEWAKELDGTPIPIYYTASNPATEGLLAGTIGHYWSLKFSAAYAALQVKLAALYDNVPEIRETDVTQCSGIFDETYLRDASDPRNVHALLAAGFTRTKDNRCHLMQLRAQRVWWHTSTVVAFNPYQSIAPDGTVRPDLDYTESQMLVCRHILGVRCILGNHSIDQDRISQPGMYATMYQRMEQLGGVAFQTSTIDKIGDLQWVLNWANQVGADSVELPTGYTDQPASTYAPAASAFAQRQASYQSGGPGQNTFG